MVELSYEGLMPHIASIDLGISSFPFFFLLGVALRFLAFLLRVFLGDSSSKAVLTTSM